VSRRPQCRHENPGDAKFCLECGRRLALSCGACGTELPAGAKFCKECGQAVGAATPTAGRVGAPPRRDDVPRDGHALLAEQAEAERRLLS
jgi:predicted amidophosphoribosyltransferase